MLRRELIPGAERLFGPLHIDLLGSHQRNAAVAMFFVILGEKVLAESPTALDGAKALGELRAILERSELGE